MRLPSGEDFRMRTLISTCVCAMSAILSSGELACATTAESAPAPALRQDAHLDQKAHYIVQAASLGAARRAVIHAGAVPGRDLGIIHAVAAELTDTQRVRLEARGGARAYPDRTVSSE